MLPQKQTGLVACRQDAKSVEGHASSGCFGFAKTVLTNTDVHHG